MRVGESDGFDLASTVNMAEVRAWPFCKALFKNIAIGLCSANVHRFHLWRACMAHELRKKRRSRRYAFRLAARRQIVDRCDCPLVPAWRHDDGTASRSQIHEREVREDAEVSTRQMLLIKIL